MSLYRRHELTLVELSEITKFFDRYIESNKSRGELKNFVNAYADKKSPEKALNAVDYMIDLQINEEGVSTEQVVVQYLNDFQAQFLGGLHNGVPRLQEV